MISLTSRQQEVLDLLIAYQRKHGFPPTTFELTGMLGCRSPMQRQPISRRWREKGNNNHPRRFSRHQHKFLAYAQRSDGQSQ